MAKKKKTIRSIPQQRTPVREQDPRVRVKNFDEVNCGYSLEEALNEAERCLLCPDPDCVAGCPVNINIPKFIEAITAKDFRGAYNVVTASNLLAAVCGRVCPQETQCEGVCVVGESLEPVAIGRLERWVGDQAIKEKWANVPYVEPSGFKVGIVSFSDKADVNLPPTSDKEEALNALNSLQAENGTALGDAISRSVNVGLASMNAKVAPKG
jgi:glutamate synthase (NADPH/NADH) small chain